MVSGNVVPTLMVNTVYLLFFSGSGGIKKSGKK